MAGSNDTDADCTDCAVALLTTPGFKGNEHPRECLNFWYNIKVCTFSVEAMMHRQQIFASKLCTFPHTAILQNI